MTEQSDWPTPGTILAFAGLAGVVGAVLYFVLPVLGAAAGLFVAVSSTGLSTAGVIGGWVAPVASAGTAVLATGVAVTIVKRIADSARKDPYDWGLPLLGVFGGLASTLATDIGLETSVAKWLFGGVTALLIVVAGAYYARSGLRWKIVAVSLYLLPPLAMVGWSLVTSGSSTLREYFAQVGIWTWMGVGSLMIIGILLAVLAHLGSKQDEQRAA